jgi:hypothetical protein
VVNLQWSDTSGNTGILQEILDSLEQPLTDTGRWSFAKLLRRANLVMRDACERSECLKTISTSNTSVSGTATVTKPTGCSRIMRIAYGNYRLFGITKAELDMNVKNWQDLTGISTGGWYIDLPTTIQLVPIPDDTGSTITIEYIAQPTELSVATDIPFNAQNNLYSFHDLIVLGVVTKCLFDGKSANITLASKWESRYNKRVEELKEFVRNQPDTMLTISDLSSDGYGSISPLPSFFRNR